MPQIINAATINADLGATPVVETSTVTVQLDDVWFNKRADKENWNDGPLTYTIEVRNDGDPTVVPTPPDLENIVITDAIDIANLRVINNEFIIEPDSGTYTYDPLTGNLQVNLDPIAPGDMVTITFQVERIFP